MEMGADRRGSGFTLVELLSVIAVIALLAGLLFPALATAQARGRASACVSNLGQIGVALTIYLSDHGSIYPFNQPALALLPTHLASPKVLGCPANTRSRSHNYSVTENVQSGYNWSYRIFYRPGGVDTDKAPVQASLLRFPHLTPLVADADWIDQGGPPYWWLSHYIHKCWLEPGSIYGFDVWNAHRHPAGVNTLFADGHVEALTAEAYTNRILRKGDIHPVTGYHLTE
jgi:prepilin-type processing-associated H-X9-DG protein/prepilin-type N-terminal cleavage/methylation domain-containing protein